MIRDRRTDLIKGLLDLAAFLEAHPEVPVSSHVVAHHFPDDDRDDVMCAEIDEIATYVGSRIDFDDSPYGHYATSVCFGPVEYRAVAVLAAARARHAAERSYTGCIDPDPTPDL
ncbi:hypothetical protein MF672_005925 [Actinomadura sp. ATCC 31491]|uniref:DUF695 domain-containing protein n=1 Tax=Actinomadura luzonensis TaxID=2805427 RepID=A0ABT0FM05_9ACTN|nr:hypothetical protein [Actinomadura luzonensis]MCK2213332.1 hypothetical protein [Actinomadura luzonensis]